MAAIYVFPMLRGQVSRRERQRPELGTYVLAAVNDALAELAALRGPRPIVLFD